jgi:hypothetical protein
MSSSIFNFRENFGALGGILDRNFLIASAFAIFFFGLTLIFLGGVRGTSSGSVALMRSAALGALTLGLVATCARFRNLRPIFASIVFSVLGFLVVGEIYFRLAFFGVDSIVRLSGYVPASVDYPLCRIPVSGDTHTGFKPNTSSLLKGALFRTNDFGFRDRDRTLKKKEGTVRILVIGASHMIGAGVSQEEVFSYVLEDRLNANDDSIDYEVINLSRGGYQTIDLLDVLKRWGLRFDPDIILVKGRAGERKKLRRIRTVEATPLEKLESMYYYPYSASFFFQAIRSNIFHNVVRRLQDAVRAAFEPRHDPSAREEGPLIALDEIKRESENSYYLQEQFVELAGQRRLFFVNRRHLPDRDLIIYIGDNHANEKTHRVYAEELYNQLRPTLQEISVSMRSASL